MSNSLPRILVVDDDEDVLVAARLLLKQHDYVVQTETDPGLKGDTSGSGGKPATLETGAVVRIPLFVQIGEAIKVDTRSGEYVSRAKE